jgi:hypothetical protein
VNVKLSIENDGQKPDLFEILRFAQNDNRKPLRESRGDGNRDLFEILRFAQNDNRKPLRESRGGG